jgi:hypothetical protein
MKLTVDEEADALHLQLIDVPMIGLSLGAAYCFDEEAYDRFFPLA